MRDTRKFGRHLLFAVAVAMLATNPASAQSEPKPDSLGTRPVTRAPTLDPQADTAPKSPAEIEADALGPPVKTKTFRVGPDGKPK